MHAWLFTHGIAPCGACWRRASRLLPGMPTCPCCWGWGEKQETQQAVLAQAGTAPCVVVTALAPATHLTCPMLPDNAGNGTQDMIHVLLRQFQLFTRCTPLAARHVYGCWQHGHQCGTWACMRASFVVIAAHVISIQLACRSCVDLHVSALALRARSHQDRCHCALQTPWPGYPYARTGPTSLTLLLLTIGAIALLVVRLCGTWLG